MSRAVVIAATDSESSIPQELGEDFATDLYSQMVSALIEEHTCDSYTLYLHESVTELLDDSDRRPDVIGTTNQVLDEAEQIVLLAARSLVDRRKVEQVFDQLDSSSMITSRSPRGHPVISGVTNQLPAFSPMEHVQRFIEGDIRKPASSVTPLTMPDEPLIIDEADLSAAYTWSFHSDSFAKIRPLLSEYDSPVSISFVTATYKRPEQTIEMLDSVRESLAKFSERYPDGHLEYEHRVCCYEDDRESIRRLRSYDWDSLEIDISESNSVTAKRDHSMRSANYEYIMSIDSDCIVKPNWVESIYRSIRKYRHPAGIQGAYDIDYPPNRNWYTEYARLRDEVRFRNKKADSRNVLFKKDVYEEIGGFNTADYADAAEDNVLRERILATGGSFVMDRSIQAYHRYPTTLLGNLKRHQYFGKGDYYTQEYDYELAQEWYTPQPRWVKFAKRIVETIRKKRAKDLPVRQLSYDFLQLVFYTIGYVQGYLHRRKSSTRQ